ncbi:MAG: macro domain-containing protein [Bacteroidota bacterium]
MMELILVDPILALCNHLRKAFEKHEHVKIIHGYFEAVEEFDCMVSAANSFGLMDGGVDLAIINFFGHQLEKQVQEYIIAQYFGEQPVGTCFLIETGNEKHPFVAHTPTMRIPMTIHGTDNVYLAMKAMLETIWHHNQKAETQKIKRVVCPGLGTATGKMPYAEAARQMQLAYANFISPIERINWDVAGKRQLAIRYGGNLGFNFDTEG